MLSNLLDSNYLKQHKVVYFRSAEYPVNFFRLFFKELKKHCNLNVTNVSVDKVAEWQSAKSLLEVSFLGTSSNYWFRKIGLDIRNKKKVYEYLSKYNGPHTIFLFVDSKDTLSNHNGLEILLDSNPSVVNEIIKLFSVGNSYRVSQFIKLIQKDYGRLTVDQICLLINYGSLVKDVDEFKELWVDKIIKTEKSLFDVSKYFLFRDSSKFYSAWAKISDSYPPQFWIAFLSEQLFRAYYFTFYQNQKNYRLAKQVSFKLPFDFTKSGWKYADLDLIKKSHNYLYKSDFYLKNGGSDLWLELFLNTYLNGEVS